ncbi:MAG: phytanoyl-CoA dioxygenase family protein [Candidatus Poribacteria bacterium]|nr:phytanoyl-CoA dioxygenase family protein [Candidatus Poribacteria bacterium]
MSQTTTYDIEQLLQEWRINGFTVFEDFIPLETIDRIREAWIPIRDRDIQRQGEHPSRGRFRYNVRVPFERPFVNPEIFEHPALVEFLERALGPDYVWSHFDSNIPLPGTDYQKWHRDDGGALFPGVVTPVYAVGVKFPLVDTSEQNGSFEVIPCTQYVAHSDLPTDLDTVFGKGANRRGRYYPIRLNLKKGSLWVQDGRAFHRGTPNRSDHARDELCMAFCRPWLFSRWQHESTKAHFPRDLWESLSEHARQVLRWQRVKD